MLISTAGSSCRGAEGEVLLPGLPLSAARRWGEQPPQPPRPTDPVREGHPLPTSILASRLPWTQGIVAQKSVVRGQDLIGKLSSTPVPPSRQAISAEEKPENTKLSHVSSLVLSGEGRHGSGSRFLTTDCRRQPATKWRTFPKRRLFRLDSKAGETQIWHDRSLQRGGITARLPGGKLHLGSSHLTGRPSGKRAALTTEAPPGVQPTQGNTSAALQH